MKFHWGECGEEFYKNAASVSQESQRNLSMLYEHAKKTSENFEKENKALKDRIVSLCNQYRLTATIEENAVNMFNMLSDKFCVMQSENEQLKNKVSHLEHVISDYQKVTLLEETPAYVEMSLVAETTKTRKSRKA